MFYNRSLIEASLDPLVVINTSGQITDLNNAMIKVTGYSRKQLLNTPFSKYFTDSKIAEEVYQCALNIGFLSDYRLTLKHKNKRLTDVLYNSSVYKDSDDKVLGVVAIAHEVTDQKWFVELRNANKKLALQNEEKEKRAAELVIANEELLFQNEEKEKRATELGIANKELVFQNKEKEKQEIATKELEALSFSEKLVAQYSRSLIEASLDPFVTISIEGKILDVNEASIKVTGINREKLIGTNFSNYFTDPQKAKKG
jgi:PAS domain S-box-containing protein